MLVQLQQTLAGRGQLWVVMLPPLEMLVPNTRRQVGGSLKTKSTGHTHTHREADLRTYKRNFCFQNSPRFRKVLRERTSEETHTE